jgi:plasmid stabilization system protein ParE
MTKDEALELALEALEEAWYHVGTFQPTEKAIDLYDEARAAIKEALAQPEQPKVRTGDCLLVGVCASEGHKIQVKQEPWRESASDYERGVIDGRQMQAQSSVDKAVNAMSRIWVGLTDEEIADCAEKMEASDPTDSFWREFFRGIEAKLKEKNT